MQKASIHLDARQAVVEGTGVAFVEELFPADIELQVGVQHVADGGRCAMYAEIGRTQSPIGGTFAQLAADDPRARRDCSAEVIARGLSGICRRSGQ